MQYNKLNALVYEVIEFICRFKPNLKRNPWISRARENCLPDWVEFRTQVLMKQLDEEVQELHEDWITEEAEHFDPIFLEFEFAEESDKTPLGKPMGLSSAWSFYKHDSSF